MADKKVKVRSLPRAIEEFTELRLFAVKFRDSENQPRDAYILRNSKGKSYILDLGQSGLLVPHNPMVPELRITEKLNPQELKSASLCGAPQWLSEAVSKHMAGESGPTEEDVEEAQEKSKLSKMATMGDEDED